MWDYSDKVKEYFFNPKNSGPLEDANGVGDVGAISCGDALRLMIKVDPPSDTILDARFQTFGCGSAIASSSALTEIIIGKSIEEALTITNQDIADYLGGLPPEKMHCSVMGYEALRAAVANYKGEAWGDDHEEGELICKCFGVDEGTIERAVRNNLLNNVEAVTFYTKAGGGCTTCGEQIEAVIEKTNAALVAEGKLEADKAFTRTAKAPAKPKKNVIPIEAIQAAIDKKETEKKEELPKVVPGQKLTTVQRIKIIEHVLAELRPVFKRDGGDCELVDVHDDVVLVKLSGSCHGCHLEAATLNGVQERLMETLHQRVQVIPINGTHH